MMSSIQSKITKNARREDGVLKQTLGNPDERTIRHRRENSNGNHRAFKETDSGTSRLISGYNYSLFHKTQATMFKYFKTVNQLHFQKYMLEI